MPYSFLFALLLIIALGGVAFALISNSTASPKIGILLKNVTENQFLVISMFCHSPSAAANEILLGSTFCNSKTNIEIAMNTKVNLADGNKTKNLCANNKIFINVRDDSEMGQLLAQSSWHSNEEEQQLLVQTNWFSNKEKKKLWHWETAAKVPNKKWQIFEPTKATAPSSAIVAAVTDVILSEDELLAQIMQKNSKKEVEKAARIEEAQSSTNAKEAHSVAITDGQMPSSSSSSSPLFSKTFELNVLQLFGTDAIVLDISSVPLPFVIKIHDHNGAAEGNGSRYLVLLYCYTVVAEQEQKSLMIFGNAIGFSDGGKRAMDQPMVGEQKVEINTELSNLDELQHCHNNELFIYIEREEKGGDKTPKRVAEPFANGQFANEPFDNALSTMHFRQ